MVSWVHLAKTLFRSVSVYQVCFARTSSLQAPSLHLVQSLSTKALSSHPLCPLWSILLRYSLSVSCSLHCLYPHPLPHHTDPYGHSSISLTFCPLWSNLVLRLTGLGLPFPHSFYPHRSTLPDTHHFLPFKSMMPEPSLTLFRIMVYTAELSPTLRPSCLH